ncbi:GTP cyclohydrolase I [Candidatus Gottesmanbacteria bacterium]|nr:GTP cyclohydrolase I [Candidatus Gottesmanbacteria bacterium]
MNTNTGKFVSFIKSQLENLGLDVHKPALIRTPERAQRAFEELTRFHTHKDQIEKHFVFFPSSGSHQLVVVAPIFFGSLCEHHLLPFFGFVSIGYIPNGKILGLSKFKRIIELVTKQVIIQERLTKEIFDLFTSRLNPKGLVVMLEAKHTCVLFRGVKDGHSVVKTLMKSQFFNEHATELQTFFQMIQNHEKP